MLSLEHLKSVLRYEPETGNFIWIGKQNRNTILGTKAGHLNRSGYVYISINKTGYLAHRLAWFYTHGEWPIVIDHINHNRSDNSMQNLRNVSYVMNSENKVKPTSRNKSGYLGVCFEKGKWKANIYAYGKGRHLGRFNSPEEAYAAYLAAKRLLHLGNTL